MPNWEVATALGITLLVGLSTHLFYRRPPAALWPALPLVFGTALVFSFGDLLANLWPENESIRWAGMIMIYTGLLTIAPSWWLFTRNFSKMYGYDKVAFQSGLQGLLIVNGLLWLGLVTNPWHGQFIEAHAGSRSSYGPLWYATAAINYSALLAAMWVHARASLKITDPVIRSQCHFLVAAVIIPLSMNMAYVFSPTPLPYDPTALGFALSCTLFLFAVERRGLFALERISLPSLLNSDADAVLIITNHHRLLFANSAAEMLFGPEQLVPGCAVDELLAQAVPTFSLTDTPDSSPEKSGREHRFTSPSTAGTWVLIEVSAVQRTRSVPAGLSLRLRNRGALRAARREADEHLALLEALDLATGEGLLVQDGAGEIRYVNDAFSKLWKTSSDKVRTWERAFSQEIGDSLLEAPPEVIGELWHTTPEEFDSTGHKNCDLQLLDGRIFELATFPITTHKGFTGRAWRVSDVTRARRESQAMIQSQKLEGLGVLAGGIAHDFNNLLVAILGNVELAQAELPSSSSVQESLSDVEAAAISASQLTGQLLAYAGKSAFMREDINLSTLLEEMTNLIGVSIPKNIIIEYHLEQNLPAARGGIAEMRQVVMNLVTNAADAIGEDGGKIIINTGIGKPSEMLRLESSTEYGKKSDPAVYFSVTDDGHGMDATTLEKIFDPFFTTRFTGRGLGLAATRGILNVHDGFLKIETALGVGSTFTVSLPAGEMTRQAAPTHPNSATEESRHAHRTILAVDDEESVRNMLSKRLMSAGFNVLTASSGKAALSLLQKTATNVDLVVLDITMPEISGIETRACLLETHPELPILLSSGYPEETLGALHKGRASLDGFIQKPYRSSTLFTEIDRLLTGSA